MTEVVFRVVDNGDEEQWTGQKSKEVGLIGISD